MNRLNIFVIGLLFTVTVLTSCDKEKLELEEFCLYANVEDFYKTAPFINGYLKDGKKMVLYFSDYQRYGKIGS